MDGVFRIYGWTRSCKWSFTNMRVRKTRHTKIRNPGAVHNISIQDLRRQRILVLLRSFKRWQRQARFRTSVVSLEPRHESNKTKTKRNVEGVHYVGARALGA